MRFFLVLFLFIFFGCEKGVTTVTNGSLNSTKGDKFVLVKTKELKETTYSYTMNFSGIVKSFDRVDVGFNIAGRIDKIFFNEGDTVIKDDKLAVLMKEELEASYRQSKASFNKAKNAYKRNKKLLLDGTISSSEIESYEAEYKIKEAALDLSRIKLEYATLYAPISGKLAFRNIEEKEIVLPNMTYFTIMNIDNVILEIGVPEYQISKMFTGQKAIAKVDAYPGDKFEGEIYQVAVSVNDFNKLFKVEIKIPNKQELLRPGMIADVEIEIETFKNICLIPINAMLELNGNKYIYLERDGLAVKKFLEKFYIHNDNIILLDSLNKGDRLITKGHQMLSDGEKVYEQETEINVSGVH